MVETAIVTGGASGIGLALGRALVARGVHVVVADIDGQAAEEAAGALDRLGPGSASGAQLDVADGEAVSALVTDTHREHRRLDWMFNNAGIGVGGEPDELGLEHWDRIIDVNLRGVVHGCHAAYPLMKAQGFGRIVNTASMAGLGAGPGPLAPYNMTKHGVVGLSLALRAAGADLGVGVHVVCPGAVETPILDKKDVDGLPTPPSLANVELRGLLRKAGFKRFYPPDRLAADVLKAVEKNKAVIVAPRQARIGWFLIRLFPRLGDSAALRLTRWYREEAATP